MSLLTGIPLVGDIIKTVFGSRLDRDIQAHTEQISVYNQFAQEFGHSKTKWDSFIDGLNRLPRPIMTFGVIWLFYYCVSDPDGFDNSARALKSMPYEGWVCLWMVIGFWFGTRAVEKMPSVFGKLNKSSQIQPVKKIEPETIIDVNTDLKNWDNLVEKRYSNYKNIND